MSDRKKKTVIPSSSSLYDDKLDDTASSIDQRYEMPSDLIKLVNKNIKSYTNLNTNKLIIPKITTPSNRKLSKEDKTVCNEDELARIQQQKSTISTISSKVSRHSIYKTEKSFYSRPLDLNKPYLKSLTDITHLNRSSTPTKDKKDHKKKS